MGLIYRQNSSETAPVTLQKSSVPTWYKTNIFRVTLSWYVSTLNHVQAMTMYMAYLKLSFSCAWYHRY